VTASPLKELVLTDTIMATDAIKAAPNIRQVPIAPLLGEAVKRISEDRSVSSLFD
jgi:ribose-phosphate pyrophosphokinase